MKLKNIFTFILTITICLSLCLIGCSDPTEKGDGGEVIPDSITMNTDFPICDTLPDGERKRVKVILLLGQSNATGCSIVEYLKNNLDEEEFGRYESGFPSVLINYCLDDHNATSSGEFVNVNLTCGATDGFFGPEVGIADVLSKAYPDEQIIILKYTMSGYTINYHWLSGGERGAIYNACLKFTETYMDYLLKKNYDARIGAVCWMQGESDTTDFKAAKYYDNQTALASYLREDLAKYSENGGIYFIDAGISNSPYCEPAYPTVNAAKEKFSKDSPLNIYFSTIDEGLTVHKEPEGEPDWGHYDSLSELKLGQLFGQYVVESYQSRGK